MDIESDKRLKKWMEYINVRKMCDIHGVLLCLYIYYRKIRGRERLNK